MFFGRKITPEPSIVVNAFNDNADTTAYTNTTEQAVSNSSRACTENVRPTVVSLTVNVDITPDTTDPASPGCQTHNNTNVNTNSNNTGQNQNVTRISAVKGESVQIESAPTLKSTSDPAHFINRRPDSAMINLMLSTQFCQPEYQLEIDQSQSKCLNPSWFFKELPEKTGKRRL